VHGSRLDDCLRDLVAREAPFPDQDLAELLSSAGSDAWQRRSHATSIGGEPVRLERGIGTARFAV
jgi:hypothetical protein